MQAKDKRREIVLMMYDLSAAFDTISHTTLIDKLKTYGFDKHAITWMTSYLKDRTQIVNIEGQSSSSQSLPLGTPQGSRISPLLFICIMADLDLWTEDCVISNFADDTQTLCVAEEKETVVAKTTREATNVMSFFSANDLVNNAGKACVIYNTKGQGDNLILEDVGGVKLTSLKENESEKLLGLQISREFNWKIHVDMLAGELKKKIGLMRRIRNRLTRGKMLMVAESIFNSKVRYGIALYLNPTFETEDVKARKLSVEASKLQVIQNSMLRTIFNYRLLDKVNMEKLRNNIKMFSINQMNIYHVLLEAFNVISNGSAEKIQEKWMPGIEKHYSNRREFDVKVPSVDHVRCQGFTWFGAKLWNSLPEEIKAVKNPDSFKEKVKEYIWEKIPSF